jgi:hypothetical protein
MKRTVLLLVFLAALTLPGGLAWGDGEEIQQYDPNTGVILPARPSPAQVERESLEIEFQPVEVNSAVIRMVKVRAQYWLRNPTDKPLKLEIGFPAPGGAMQLVETPVRLDGRPVDWRLLHYEEMFKPLQPSLIRAMQRWADRHPRAVRLAEQIRELDSQRLPYPEREERKNAPRQQLQTELIKAGAPSPNPDAYMWLHASREAPRAYRDLWELRRALLATGQRRLLPEERWYVDHTMLDPATGKQLPPGDGQKSLGSVSMLIFPLHLQPKGHHSLEVIYQQDPSQDREDGRLCHFGYILRTVRRWASFGPIETTIKAPARLVFHSLPALRYVGMSHGLKVYQGVILQPRRNLQVVLASREMLWPRLKVNGGLRDGRRDALVDGTPTFPTSLLGHVGLRLTDRRWQQGEVVLARKGVTLRVRPGERQMLVNGEVVPLPTPVVVRKGTSYLPLEALQALYPDYQITLSYDAPSRTVLLGAKPKTSQPAPSPTG